MGRNQRQVMRRSEEAKITGSRAAAAQLPPEPVFSNVYGAPESIPRNEFRQPTCSLAGRYDNPLPPRFLAPIDSLKIPAQISCLSVILTS